MNRILIEKYIPLAYKALENNTEICDNGKIYPLLWEILHNFLKKPISYHFHS